VKATSPVAVYCPVPGCTGSTLVARATAGRPLPRRSRSIPPTPRTRSAFPISGFGEGATGLLLASTSPRSGGARLGGLLVALAGLLVAGCGGHSPTGPSSVPAAQGQGGLAQAPPPTPAFLLGYFARAEDAGDPKPANWQIIPLQFSLDPEMVAKECLARRTLVTVAVHYVFMNPRATWPASWKQAVAWMAPFKRLGILHSVYVLDEPTSAGLNRQWQEDALGIVRAAGYRTMMAEEYHWVNANPSNGETYRPPVDIYAMTCYPPHPAFNKCADLYNARPDVNMVIGEAFSGMTADGEIYNPGDDQWRWYEAAKGSGKMGLAWWVWRWPSTVGAADDPAILEQHKQIAAREGIIW